MKYKKLYKTIHFDEPAVILISKNDCSSSYLSHLYYVKVDGGVSKAVLDLLYGFSG